MNKNDKWNVELSEYIKQGEPTQVEKTEIWETAIGLQDVDGLKPSNYLVLNAKEHIEGKIDIKEVKQRLGILQTLKAEIDYQLTLTHTDDEEFI